MVAIVRSDDVRKQNRMRVLDAVRRAPAASRTDIGKLTGLSPATVSAITSDLLNEGVLIHPPVDSKEHLQTSSVPRGRPKVALMVNPNAALVCAVYFQLSSVSASLVDYAGNPVANHELSINPTKMSLVEIRQALFNCIEAVLQPEGENSTNLSRISVGFQGVADVAGTAILWSPICRERDIPIKAWLEEHFSVPSNVANDCDMIAQALTWRDPETYGENFATILLAHGVGMGLLLRKEIVNGTRSSGVEFGHMNHIPGGARCRCGNFGCIEAYAGDYAISRRAEGHGEHTPPSGLLDPPDLGAIATAARLGESDAIDAIDAAGTAIGTGLANLFALVDPFPVVFVGRGAVLIDLMEPSIRKALQTSPDDDIVRNLFFLSIVDETPLVLEGCATSALLDQDDQLAMHSPHPEAAE